MVVFLLIERLLFQRSFKLSAKMMVAVMEEWIESDKKVIRISFPITEKTVKMK